MSYTEMNPIQELISREIGTALIRVERMLAKKNRPDSTDLDAVRTRIMEIHDTVIKECSPELLRAALLLFDKTYKQQFGSWVNRNKIMDGKSMENFFSK